MSLQADDEAHMYLAHLMRDYLFLAYIIKYTKELPQTQNCAQIFGHIANVKGYEPICSDGIVPFFSQEHTKVGNAILYTAVIKIPSGKAYDEILLYVYPWSTPTDTTPRSGAYVSRILLWKQRDSMDASDIQIGISFQPINPLIWLGGQ